MRHSSILSLPLTWRIVLQSVVLLHGVTFLASVAVAQVINDTEFAEALPLLDRSEFSAAADASLSSDSPGAGDDLQQLKEKRFRDLKSKLNELSGMMSAPLQPRAQVPQVAAPRPAAPEQTRTMLNGPPATNNADTKTDVPVLSRDNADLNASARTPAPHGEPALLPDAMPFPTSQNHVVQSPQKQLPQGIPVIERGHEVPQNLSEDPLKGPIDRFSLACSLFGTGDLESCLKVIRQVNLKELSREDQIWVNFMQACCHRKAGRVDEARVLFRQIVADPEADWMKEPARWWLDNLNAKSKVIEDIERLRETLRAWETEIATLGN